MGKGRAKTRVRMSSDYSWKVHYLQVKSVAFIWILFLCYCSLIPSFLVPTPYRAKMEVGSLGRGRTDRGIIYKMERYN